MLLWLNWLFRSYGRLIDLEDIVSVSGEYNSVSYEIPETEVIARNGDAISSANAGEATIIVVIETNHGTVRKYFTINVVENIDVRADELLALLAANNEATNVNKFLNQMGYMAMSSNLTNTVYGSVNNYYFGELPATLTFDSTSIDLTSSYTDPNFVKGTTVDKHGGLRQGPVEFIVIHDVGANGSGDRAKNTAEYTKNNGQTSYHYIIGEISSTDTSYGIINCLPEEYIGYHVGDDAVETQLFDTGIPATDYTHRPKVTIGDENYYYIDGVKS